MPTTREVLQAIHDDAWASLSVTSMQIDGIDDVLRDQECCVLVDTGVSYGTAATLAYLRSRGWLNVEKMHAELDAS
jgi:hypothetical protein